jgi:Protein of unknown function (DUF3293)
MPDPALDAAYRDTNYRVEEPPGEPFTIRIGEASAAVDRILALHHQSEWAFITACNSGSTQLPDEENAQRLTELEAVCLYHGWPHYLGVSVGRDGTWREPSFLVVGIPEVNAIEVARHFGQNAIVVGRIGETARLVWVT